MLPIPFGASLAIVLTLFCVGPVIASDSVSATFFRGINLNGPAVVIDGNAWEGAESSNYECNDKAFENQKIELVPLTDPERARMIRSSRWGGNTVHLRNLPSGRYSVLLYVWEDNNTETFSVLLNDKVVAPNIRSGSAGQWQRLGPWPVVVKDGAFTLSSKGGAANFSGIEIWKGDHDGVAPWEMTAEGVEFFERRIRPVLVNRCYECHSAESAEVGGDLLVDSRHGIRHGGGTGPAVVPGDLKKSLLFTAMTYTDKDLQMPPDGKLTEEEISDFKTWIEMNAPDPRYERKQAPRNANIDWKKGRDWWSLKPVQNPVVPAIQNADWPLNDLDRFILYQLEQKNLKPATDVDKAAWIRRVTYDLIGLPPRPEEVDAFLQDTSAQAFETVVDRLLSTRQYGERWGRYWLDVVRYSDTAGDNSDFPIPQMYRYRNWVIEAFCRDLPYDQFVMEQIAGDLMGGETEDIRYQRVIATGYIANSRRFGSRVDDYPQHLTIEDTLDNLGRTFLGTTINCARCHNHKFDPITNDDYYALYGIFHSTRYPWPGIELEQKQRDLIPLAGSDQVARSQALRNEKISELKSRVEQAKKEWKEQSDPKTDRAKELKQKLEAAEKELNQFEKSPPDYDMAYAVTESRVIEDVAVQLKGDPTRLGPVVPRRFLEVLDGAKLDPTDTTSGRLELARWITDPKNPLAARVMVNRIWQGHFGKGIVPTPSDFGRQGKPPSHPELLDWLAHRFVSQGWSIKALHREILLSRTYRMSTNASDQSLADDPTNEWLSHFPRRRLDAESLRDSLLYLSGKLDLSSGGPHPFPEQQSWAFTQHNPFKAVYETNRRSVYLMTQRIQRHPYLAIFDGADPSTSTPRRLSSTTPLQALYLLNDAFVHEQAAGFAKRLQIERESPEERIRFAYRLVFARSVTQSELEQGIRFVERVHDRLTQEGHDSDRALAGSWEAYCRTLFRLNEFVYLD